MTRPSSFATVMLVLPAVLGGCPALLSDWSLGTGATDASSDALSPDVAGSGCGSATEGSSGSSSASTGGLPSSSASSGSPSGSSSGGTDAGPAPEEAGTHVVEPDTGKDVVVAPPPDAQPDAGTMPDLVQPPDAGVDAGPNCGLLGSCGATCQTKHNTGIPSPVNYYDCNPTGNSQAKAQAACGAFMTANGISGGGSACSQSQAGSCCCPLGNAQAICGAANGKCYCWQYSGANAGTVQTVGGACSAVCGSANDPAWN